MAAFVQRLADHRFAEFFREELGWDRAHGVIGLDVDGRRLEFVAVAEKRGFQVLHCPTHRRVLINRALLRRAQAQVARRVHEHILIYSCDRPAKQVWQWAYRKSDGRRLSHREHPFFSANPPVKFLERLGRLRFSLEEESDVSIVDALQRVHGALDVAAEMELFAKKPKLAARSDELAVAMARGEPGAFQEFIVFHLRLAHHNSKWLQSAYSIDQDEAEQIAVIGLIEAARRFDPERGYQFSTYASYWIRQTCQRLGPMTALPIRLPCHVMQRFFPMRRRLERLNLEFGPGRSADELLQRCLQDKKFFWRWLCFERALRVHSLSDRRCPEYREARRLEADSADLLSLQLRTELAERVREAIDRLRPREARFVRLRHGFDGHPRTLEEIGQAERLTRERVRQILVHAEAQLATLLRAERDEVGRPAQAKP